MEMQKAALSLALESEDITTAKDIVLGLDGEDYVDLKNELWLYIAKFVVTQQKDYKRYFIPFI